MRLASRVVGIILIIAGLLWTLQGSNVIGGSVMSGKGEWLSAGIACLIVGIIAAWWGWRRR